MKNNIIQLEMDVKGSKINVVRVDGYEYISLTDLARTQNDEAPADVVKNWLRNKETISFLGVWEELNNENFKVVEFEHFKNEAGRHAFTMSPQKWTYTSSINFIDSQMINECVDNIEYKNVLTDYLLVNIDSFDNIIKIYKLNKNTKNYEFYKNALYCNF